MDSVGYLASSLKIMTFIDCTLLLTDKPFVLEPKASCKYLPITIFQGLGWDCIMNSGCFELALIENSLNSLGEYSKGCSHLNIFCTYLLLLRRRHRHLPYGLLPCCQSPFHPYLQVRRVVLSNWLIFKCLTKTKLIAGYLPCCPSLHHHLLHLLC